MTKQVKGKIQPDKIFIENIRVSKSNVDSTEEYLNNPVAPSGVIFSLSQKSGFDIDNKKIRIVLNFLIEGMESEEKQLGLKAEYAIDFIFNIENIMDFVNVDEKSKKHMLSSDLGTTLMAIAYSTSRGIILDRTQGTYFKGVTIPVIDPKDILTNKLSENNLENENINTESTESKETETKNK